MGNPVSNTWNRGAHLNHRGYDLGSCSSENSYAWDMQPNSKWAWWKLKSQGCCSWRNWLSKGLAWWPVPTVPALGRPSQEYHQNLGTGDQPGHIARLHRGKPKKEKRTKGLQVEGERSVKSSFNFQTQSVSPFLFPTFLIFLRRDLWMVCRMFWFQLLVFSCLFFPLHHPSFCSP